MSQWPESEQPHIRRPIKTPPKQLLDRHPRSFACSPPASSILIGDREKNLALRETSFQLKTASPLALQSSRRVGTHYKNEIAGLRESAATV